MQKACYGKLLVSLAAHNDRAALARWEDHLLPLQQARWLTFRSEHNLQAGEERLQFLTTCIDQAQIIVLLLSADFFASEECMALLAYVRSSPQQEVKQLIPLLVRPVLWQESSVGGMACLPTNAIPVSKWESEDEGWHACVQGLLPLLKYTPTLLHAYPSDKRDRGSRATLLRLLRRDYQRDQDESLEQLAWLELELAEHPHGVYNATHCSQYRSDQSARALPAGTSILQVYDEAKEALLILGDPGAGKSTLLRELALHLVTRAQADGEHPLPVIFPLSSWAINRAPLADWMKEQLARIYAVPQDMATQCRTKSDPDK